MDFLKKLFEKPSAHVIAQQSLDDHFRSLLEAQQQEDAARNTVQYHKDCIARLQRFVVNDSPEVM